VRVILQEEEITAGQRQHEELVSRIEDLEHQLALTEDESQLLTTNGVSGDVSVIDVDSLQVTKSIGVGRYPWGVVIKP